MHCVPMHCYCRNSLCHEHTQQAVGLRAAQRMLAGSVMKDMLLETAPQCWSWWLAARYHESRSISLWGREPCTAFQTEAGSDGGSQVPSTCTHSCLPACTHRPAVSSIEYPMKHAGHVMHWLRVKSLIIDVHHHSFLRMYPPSKTAQSRSTVGDRHSQIACERCMVMMQCCVSSCDC
jgi:hypothetical protein